MYSYSLKQKKLVIAPVVIKFNVSYFIGISFTASPFSPLLLLVCNYKIVLECKITAPIHDLISVTILNKNYYNGFTFSLVRTVRSNMVR